MQSLTTEHSPVPEHPALYGVEPGRAKKKTCVGSTPRKGELGDKTTLPPTPPPPPPPFHLHIQ